MSLVATGYEHIVVGDNMVPMITGTTTKVVELVMEHIAYGWSPEEIHLQHPYLRLGQIYSALAYYWDHVEQLNQDIEQRMQVVDEIQQSMKPSLLKQRLKARATELQRVLFTFDDDLLCEATRRQTEGIPFAGVIYAHILKVSIGKCISDLELIAKSGEPEDLRNTVEFLPL